MSSGSGCLAVLVDESVAGGVLSDRSAGPILDDVRVVRCALSEAAMWSVGVVVLEIFVEELCELSLVPDQGPVTKFAADGPDPAFRVAFATGVYGGVRMIVVPSARKTSSKPPRNWPAPSRIKNRIVGSERIRKFRALGSSTHCSGCEWYRRDARDASVVR